MTMDSQQWPGEAAISNNKSTLESESRGFKPHLFAVGTWTGILPLWACFLIYKLRAWEL